MIEKRWLDSLNDPDPEIRKQAVRAITNSSDENAMNHLAKVYRTDSDPEVREMARQGGIKLRQMGYRVGSAEPEQSYSRYEDRRDEDVYDPMAGLYETPLQEERPPARDVPSEPVDRQRRKSANTSELSWAGVTPDLLLYFIIVAVGTFIVTMILAESMEPMLDEIFSQESTAEIEAIRTQLENSTGAYIITAAVTGVLAVMTLVFQIWIIHYLATSSFGGYGNMFTFLRKYAIASAVLTVIVYGVTTYFVVATFAAMPDLSQNTTTTAAVSEDYTNLLFTLCCGVFFGLIGVVWYFGQMISRHYFIGTWAGIGSFIVAGIAAQIATQVLTNFFSSYL